MSKQKSGHASAKSLPDLTPNIQVVPIERVVPAPWNYKDPATPQQAERLKASILEDKSAGVMAVRELSNGKLECIDGNHRLEILLDIGVKNVTVENFGKITKAQAIMVAYRRNEPWFKADYAKLAVELRDTVLPEIPMDVLMTQVPVNQHEFQSLVNLANFNWESLPERTGGDNGSAKLSFAVTPHVEALLSYWEKVCKNVYGSKDRVKAVEYALRAAIVSVQADAASFKQLDPKKHDEQRKSLVQRLVKASSGLLGGKVRKEPK